VGGCGVAGEVGRATKTMLSSLLTRLHLLPVL
jgi:hypothetical protein